MVLTQSLQVLVNMNWPAQVVQWDHWMAQKPPEDRTNTILE
jgi:hypothetical protein